MRDEFEADKSNWFPRTDSVENARYDKRKPGLFKVEWEWEGDGIVSLCSKTYYCFGDGKDKFSCKGVNKKNNIINKDKYLDELLSKRSGSGVNRGFRVLRGCLRKNLQVNMGLKNIFLSYSSILKIYSWEQLKSISFYSNFL